MDALGRAAALAGTSPNRVAEKSTVPLLRVLRFLVVDYSYVLSRRFEQVAEFILHNLDGPPQIWTSAIIHSPRASRYRLRLYGVPCHLVE